MCFQASKAIWRGSHHFMAGLRGSRELKDAARLFTFQGQREQQHPGQPPVSHGAIRQQSRGARGGADFRLPRGEAQVRGPPLRTAAKVSDCFMKAGEGN